jgi:hypothetical protein
VEDIPEKWKKYRKNGRYTGKMEEIPGMSKDTHNLSIF